MGRWGPLFALWVATPAFAQEWVIDAQHLATPLTLGPGPAWRMHPGDDARWAAPDFDDHDWPLVNPFLETIPDTWPGRGWFRLALEVSPEAARQPLGMWVIAMGPVDVFLDGEPLLRRGDHHGRPGTGLTDFRSNDPLPLRLTAGRHLLAARLTAPEAHRLASVGLPGGFLVRIAGWTQMEERRELVRRGLEQHLFFLGAFLSFSALFLFVYFFAPTEKVALYYALHTLSVSGIAWFAYSRADATSVQTLLAKLTGFKISVLLTVLSGLAFYATAFFQRLTRIYWIFFWILAAALLLSPWLSVSAVYAVALLGLAEMLRCQILALQRKLADAWILTVGGSLSALGAGTQMILDATRGVAATYYLWGFLALVASMSIYLARRFARSQQTLAEQILELKELSELSLEQERRVQKEVVAKERLEAENALKGLELEEARRREKVLGELSQAHAELQRTQAQLVQQEKMASLGQLVAGVAHEINTPVGAIKSMQDSLARALAKLEQALPESERQEPKIATALKVMHEGQKVLQSGSERVATIVKKLRSFARLDEAELQRAQIHEGIEDTLLLLHHELKHGVAVERDFGSIPSIPCYPGRLNQVFLNLFVNAIHAMNGKGKLTVRTRLQDDAILVEVVDTGPGIKPENVARVFDPGFTTKGVGVGTGLGLAICYQIISDHQGSIWVESPPGKGATFFVKLPLDLDKKLELK